MNNDQEPCVKNDKWEPDAKMVDENNNAKTKAKAKAFNMFLNSSPLR